ncbi:MAG: T9SS type A sorting domain-containing protein [Bacteroidia bacterium]|nr:T9SS type A sorting domain-containing protein [Bacteroidia bacterium]
MKKFYFILLSTFICSTLIAQHNSNPFPISHLKVPANATISYDLPPVGDASAIPTQDVPNTIVNHSGNLKATQTLIGATTYDLQTNASIARRNYNDGTNSGAIWTLSLTNDLAAADRGTGYNFNSGLGWGSPPTVRIESTRQGWPSIGKSTSGNEHVISHQFTTDVRLITRPTAGSGTWTETPIPALSGIVHAWPRFAMGGTNGNSIHLIDITLPSGNGGAMVNGIDGLVTYTRSPDNGATWDIQHITLPGVDSTLYAGGFGADSYHIDASGSTVAVVAGRIDSDLALWKSTDNGTTWTKTVIMQWPFPNYDDVNSITDVDGDGMADTVMTNDGKNCVLIDNAGMAHVFAGAMLVFDDVIADPIGLFLSTDGLMYWNESMGANPPVVIATSPDRDGDGMLTYAADYVPRYGNGGATTQPSAGIDAAGNIVVSFATIMENTSSGNPTPGDFSYRNVYLMATGDNGLTWGAPLNVSNSDFDEAVFASVARNIQGSCVDLVWQQDGLPGIAVQAPDGNQALHPFGNNDIIHDCIDITLLGVGIEDINGLSAEMNVFPVPADDMINIEFTSALKSSFDINIYDASGRLVNSRTNLDPVQNTIVSIDIADLNSGLYMINIISNNEMISKKVMID